MKIIINGQQKEFTGPDNLNAVIGSVCPDAGKVIAEVNGDIIKKDLWAARPIREGDRIELVSFVGGG